MSSISQRETRLVLSHDAQELAVEQTTRCIGSQETAKMFHVRARRPKFLGCKFSDWVAFNGVFCVVVVEITMATISFY